MTGREPTPLPSAIVWIRGRVGDLVYKTYGRKIVVTRMPCFDGYRPTAAQRRHRDRMRATTALAQRIYAHPAAKTFYGAVAATLRLRTFRLIVSDYLRDDPRVRVAQNLSPADPATAQPAPTPPQVDTPG